MRVLRVFAPQPTAALPLLFGGVDGEFRRIARRQADMVELIRLTEGDIVLLQQSAADFLQFASLIAEVRRLAKELHYQ
jgi:hypothetical protein